MIPKIIHWCWLSNDTLPSNVQKCINTWREKLPDYEIMLWDFDRFDKYSSKWVSDAFDNKKYAFAADYIRLYALYNYGGIYLDSDVEVLCNFDKFLSLPSMLCWEYKSKRIEMATIGVEKKCAWIKECMDIYNKKEFILPDGTFDMTPLPQVITKILIEKRYSLVEVDSIDTAIEKKYNSNELPVLPWDYFSPKSFADGKVYKTNRTISIHQFAGSWINKRNLLKLRMKSFIKNILLAK